MFTCSVRKLLASPTIAKCSYATEADLHILNWFNIIQRRKMSLLKTAMKYSNFPDYLNPTGPGFSRVPRPRGGGGGGGGGVEVPVAYNCSKTIHGIKMKFGRVVENHSLIN